MSEEWWLARTDARDRDPKFTRPPWRVEFRDDGPVIYGGWDGDDLIARIKGDLDWEDKHNARLMAVAPRMFSFAVLVSKYLQQRVHTYVAGQLFSMANQIIAEVQGEEEAK